jgi:hypothetical protein
MNLIVRMRQAVMTPRFPVLLLPILLATLPVATLGQVTCGITYENQNQLDYSLRVRRIKGVATDTRSTSVPGTCVGVFSEPDHRPVASVATDEDGRFSFEAIRPGKYRLVALQEGFGVANVILDVGSWPSGGIIHDRRLVVHLRPRGIDITSFIDWKSDGNRVSNSR